MLRPSWGLGSSLKVLPWRLRSGVGVCLVVNMASAKPLALEPRRHAKRLQFLTLGPRGLAKTLTLEPRPYAKTLTLEPKSHAKTLTVEPRGHTKTRTLVHRPRAKPLRLEPRRHFPPHV